MTAVEWLVKTLELDTRFNGIINNVIEQAKKMEKEQSIAELRHKDDTPMRKYNSPKLQEIEMKETLEEAAENYAVQFLLEDEQETDSANRKHAFKEGAKWQQERMLKFILDEDNHTEGELGNSCIDVQTLVHFIEQFKKK